MQRRRFLALCGAGALGTAGAAVTRAFGSAPGRAAPGPPPPPGLELPVTGVRRIVWSVPTDDRVIALTFDDGPTTELTPRILDILEDFRVPATFMVMGYNAVRHAGMLEDAVAAGHEIGNHTWSHRHLRHESPEATYREIEQGARSIEVITGRPTRFFRPPQGEFTTDAVRSAAALDHDVVLWSVERREPAGTAPRRLAEGYIRRTAPGDIVLLHDGYGRGTFAPEADWAERLHRRRAEELAALPGILAGVRAAGLRFVRLSELLDRAKEASA